MPRSHAATGRGGRMDICAFCITLASRGWQRASEAALRGGHAEHIHANCDCEYAIRFDRYSTVAGYDPEKYLRQYRGTGSDVKAMRRMDYAKNRERISAQKRAAYAARKLSTKADNSAKMVLKSTHSFTSEEVLKKHFEKHVVEFGNITVEEYLKFANALSDTPISDDVVQLVRSDGSVSKYRFSTNEFVVTTKDGNIRTYFKPKDKEAYWNEEIERNKN